MATLHGFPVLLSGRQLCIVEMPDCWAILNTLDAFPQASYRFQKDEAGWRQAVAQLHRSDAPEPTVKRTPVVAGPAVNKNPRRQFSISRIGIFATAVVLGLSSRMPWAVITHNGNIYHGDLSVIMSHGWRKGLAIGLVVLAVFCAVQALAFPFNRIKLFASLAGVLALALVFIGFTQIHTFDPDLLSNPAVAIGYGSYVALGASVVLVMSWAVFPSKMRRAAPVATDPLGGYGAVNSFPTSGNFGGTGVD
ncbi:MAG: hypothetical protein ACLQOZ_12575, partial [Acidimicrobiales bacterium]